MGKPTTIELNGKKYDAITGALLGQSLVRATPQKTIAPQRHGRTIDGFIRSAVKPASPSLHPQKMTLPTAAAPKQQLAAAPRTKHADIHRPMQKNGIKAHQPERPKTLMRHVVKKPNVSMKPAIKTAAPTEMAARPKSTITKPLEKKLSVTQVNPTRLARSQQVARSHHIRKFRQPPERHVAAHVSLSQTATAIHPSQYATRPLTAIRSDIAAPKAAPRPAAAISVVQPSQPTPQKTSADIFETALAHATSHEQKAPLHARRFTARRKRLVNIMAGFGAFLLIGGFATYMNMTNIEMRVASMKAGFSVQMPSYTPAGYALDGRVENQDGTVAMHFRSGESLFTITQQASDWNSSTLLDQAAADQGQPKQTIESKGRTVFIYNGSNATWVNGGVHYQITGNASLDSEELVALATSM